MSAQFQPARKLFSVAEYHTMIDAGVFDEDDPFELIEGEIIKMSPIGPRHAASLNRLNRHLGRKAGKSAIVSVQNPVELSAISEPQPDVMLLKLRNDFYAGSLPTPADVLVAIEVADTTVETDRNVKLPTYARAGIPEVWLVDLHHDCIEIHTQPVGNRYQETRLVRRGQPIVSPAFPKLKLKADDILG